MYGLSFSIERRKRILLQRDVNMKYTTEDILPFISKLNFEPYLLSANWPVLGLVWFQNELRMKFNY